MKKQNARPVAVSILMILIGFQGLSGLIGGVGFMADPSGESLGISVDWLSGSFFDDYAIPGIILFTILGLFPLMIAGGLWKQRTWCWAGSVIVGLSLMIWITVEIFIIGYHPKPPLQLIYGLTGVSIFFITLMPSVQLYYKKEDL